MLCVPEDWLVNGGFPTSFEIRSIFSLPAAGKLVMLTVLQHQGRDLAQHLQLLISSPLGNVYANSRFIFFQLGVVKAAADFFVVLLRKSFTC